MHYQIRSTLILRIIERRSKNRQQVRKHMHTSKVYQQLNQIYFITDWKEGAGSIRFDVSVNSSSSLSEDEHLLEQINLAPRKN